MAESDTLLGYLLPRFTAEIENAATEALAYILTRSAKSREALDDLVRSGVQEVASIVRVRTQSVGKGGTKPDLVGVDENGEERVLIEAKFQADLQSTQPNGYLDRLPDNGPAVLMFLVPEDRVTRLWARLREKVNETGNALQETDSERKCMRVGETDRHLVVVSWASLLDCLAARTRYENDKDAEENIRQLRGLSEYAQATTFRPISGHDKEFGRGPEAEQRDRQLRLLIDRATDQAVNEGWLTRNGLNRTPRRYGYGRYISFTQTGVVPWFGINYDLYEQSGGITPLWLHTGPPNNKRGWVNREQFDALGLAFDMTNQQSWLPLALEPEAEFSELVTVIVRQLEEVAVILDNS